MQVKVCRDKNGCQGENAEEIKFYRNCTYEEPPPECEENWLCSEWGVCRIDGWQNRTCTDLNDCGSARTIIGASWPSKKTHTAPSLVRAIFFPNSSSTTGAR